MKKTRPLNSVFKNVPLELRQELMKYRTKNQAHGYKVRWKAREPKREQMTDSDWALWVNGGSLKWEHAQSADMYIDTGHEYLSWRIRRLEQEVQGMAAIASQRQAQLSEVHTELTRMALETATYRAWVGRIKRAIKAIKYRIWKTFNK